MARRFVTYNTEDQKAGRVNVDHNGVMKPGGSGTGLPSDVGAYKYMATDGEGKWVAADRLAWKENSVEQLVQETTLNIDQEWDYGYIKGIHKDTVPIGSDVLITFDGVEYVCKVDYVYPGSAAVGIGNQAGMYNKPNYIGNGEPFAIDLYATSDADVYCKEAGTHTISIRRVVETIHPIPAEYLPVSRIVFTYDGTNYTCNVPFDEFAAAVLNGLPMSYVDESDGLWVCTNIIVNKVGSGFEIFVYRSSGTEDIVLEYTSSGLNEVVDEA